MNHKNQFGKNALLVTLIPAAVLFLVVWVWTRTSPPPAPSPRPSPQEPARRDVVAYALQNLLQENGCADCKAWARAEILILINPESGPRQTATTLLSNKKTVATLKNAGFKILRVQQKSGGNQWDYQIE